MSRELWLLRHAKSDRNILIDDFDRPLNERGQQAAQRVGVWMKQQGLMPDAVISSPAQRTISTATIVCKAIGINEHDIHQDKRLYQERLDRIRLVLAAIPANAKKILLVGHNPELEGLLVYLAGAANVPDVEKLLPTAALARLVMPDDWAKLQAGCARLLAITHAKSLSEGGI
jgi:phosphohistidine phosphatase